LEKKTIIVATLLFSLLTIIVVTIIVIGNMFLNSLFGYDEILNQYPIGTDKKTALAISCRYWHVCSYAGPLDSKFLAEEGYSSPKRDLRTNETAVVYQFGEYMIFLYFDKNDELIHKEVCGS